MMTKKEMPLVTVLINNYNYERFVSQAIDSVLQQDYKNIEIIVVDDGSTDNSVDVIKRYGKRIKAITKNNGGQASAFNCGFKDSCGDIVCFLDADDTFLYGKISTIVNLFNNYPEADWIFHELQYTDTNGINISERIEERGVDKLLFKNFSESIRNVQRMPYLPATSGLSFRSNLLKTILPMPEKFKISADYFLRLAALCQKPGILYPENLATHRQHGENLYVNHPDMYSSDAETGLYVAYYFHRKFPEFKSFSNRLFARSAGRMVALKGLCYTLKLDESVQYLKMLVRDVDLYEYISIILCLNLNFFKMTLKKK